MTWSWIRSPTRARARYWAARRPSCWWGRGAGPIDRYFEVSPWDGGDERTWAELRPKTEDTQVQVVRIRIGFIGERLDTLVMEDSFGQTTRFTFTATKRNPRPRLDANLFRFDTSTTSDFLQID